MRIFDSVLALKHDDRRRGHVRRVVPARIRPALAVLAPLAPSVEVVSDSGTSGNVVGEAHGSTPSR